MSDCVVWRVAAGDKTMELAFDTEDVETISTSTGIVASEPASLKVVFKKDKCALWREAS